MASITFNLTGCTAYKWNIIVTPADQVTAGEVYQVWIGAKFGYQILADTNATLSYSGGSIQLSPTASRYGRANFIFTPQDQDYTFTYSADKMEKFEFIACSDIHSSGLASSITTQNFEKVRAEYENSMVCCAGDLTQKYNLTAADNVYSIFKRSYKNICCTGNHEAGNGTANISWDDWVTKTFANTLYDSAKWNQWSELSGVAFLGISMQKAGGTVFTTKDYSYPVFTTDQIAQIQNWLPQYTKGNERVIVFCHYPFENVTNPYGINKFGLSSDPFGARLGYAGSSGVVGLTSSTRGYIQPYITQSESLDESARQDTYGFLAWLAARPNVLWFSGHAHTAWEYQYGGIDDGKNYDSDGNPVKYPHIKAMQYVAEDGTKGAAMINLPSVGWNAEDAIVSVTEKDIIIKGRKNGIVDENINYVWHQNDDFTFDFTINEKPATTYKIGYNKSGGEILNTAGYNHTGDVNTSFYDYSGSQIN